jgi:excisionase family DNA binding protein
MPNPADLPQLLSMEELAERLGVTHRHVRRLIAERRVPFLRVGVNGQVEHPTGGQLNAPPRRGLLRPF